MSVLLPMKTRSEEATKKIPIRQACDDGVTAKSNFWAKYGVRKNPATELAIGNKSENNPKIPLKTRGNPIRIILSSCNGRFLLLMT